MQGGHSLRISYLGEFDNCLVLPVVLPLHARKSICSFSSCSEFSNLRAELLIALEINQRPPRSTSRASFQSSGTHLSGAVLRWLPIANSVQHRKASDELESLCRLGANPSAASRHESIWHFDSGASARDIVLAAGVNESYAVEVNKGMNLAKYVQLREVPQ